VRPRSPGDAAPVGPRPAPAGRDRRPAAPTPQERLGVARQELEGCPLPKLGQAIRRPPAGHPLGTAPGLLLTRWSRYRLGREGSSRRRAARLARREPIQRAPGGDSGKRLAWNQALPTMQSQPPRGKPKGRQGKPGQERRCRWNSGLTAEPGQGRPGRRPPAGPSGGHRPGGPRPGHPHPRRWRWRPLVMGEAPRGPPQPGQLAGHQKRKPHQGGPPGRWLWKGRHPAAQETPAPMGPQPV